MDALLLREIRRLEGLIWSLTSTATVPLAVPSVILTPFTFATASPLVLTPVGTTRPVVRAGVIITTVFDGVGATLQLGTPFSPALIMAAGDNDPKLIGKYEILSLTTFAGADTLQLLINPGAGATTGSAIVFYELGREV